MSDAQGEMDGQISGLQAALANAEAERDALSARITTIVDEAFGPFPVQPIDETLTALEAGLFKGRQEREALVAEVARLKEQLDHAYFDAFHDARHLRLMGGSQMYATIKRLSHELDVSTEGYEGKLAALRVQLDAAMGLLGDALRVFPHEAEGASRAIVADRIRTLLASTGLVGPGVGTPEVERLQAELAAEKAGHAVTARTLIEVMNETRPGGISGPWPPRKGDVWFYAGNNRRLRGQWKFTGLVGEDDGAWWAQNIGSGLIDGWHAGQFTDGTLTFVRSAHEPTPTQSSEAPHPCSIRCWRIGGEVAVKMGEPCLECGSDGRENADPTDEALEKSKADSYRRGWEAARAERHVELDAARAETLKRALEVLANRERIAEDKSQMCNVREVIIGCRRAIERLAALPSAQPITKETP